jgi:hypothetical protein
MTFLETLTDDQIALIGCIVAFAAAFAVMALTGALRGSGAGRTGRPAAAQQAPPRTVRDLTTHRRAA